MEKIETSTKLVKRETEVVKIEFYGQTIEAIQDKDGIWIFLKSVCDNFGIDFANQSRKIKNDSKFDKRYCYKTTPSKGGKQKTFCLHLDRLTAWLYSIQTARLKPEAKIMIDKYQTEATDVLNKYFFTSQQPQAVSTPATNDLSNIQDVLHKLIKVSTQNLMVQNNRFDHAEQRIEKAEQKIDKAEQRLSKIETKIAKVSPQRKRRHKKQASEKQQVLFPSLLIKTRAQFNHRISKIATFEDVPFGIVYSSVYSFFNKERKIMIRELAKKRNITVIELAEQEGWITRLYQISKECYPHV